MADQSSDSWVSEVGEEEVTTVDDLVIILISSDDEALAEEEVQEDPLVEAKVESEEEEEDWRLLALQVSNASTAQGEDSSLSGEEQPSTSATVEVEVAVEVVESESSSEEETGEEAAPISSRTRGRPPRTTPLAAPATTWQTCPEPPTVRPRVLTRASPAWEYFLVPSASNKAGADKVKCTLCGKEYSRGEVSRKNQARGTATMLRHLYSSHWSEMTPAFRAQYANSRHGALRHTGGVEVLEGEEQPVGVPVAADSDQGGRSSSDPSDQNPRAEIGNRFVVQCSFCMRIVCGLDADPANWQAMSAAHCRVCRRN